MRVLVIDHFGGDGMLDFVLRCQLAGHQVKWHIKKTDRNELFGKGLVPHIVADWREWMRWADVVVLADNTHYLRELESWRKEGIPIVGATVESAKWELDRHAGMDVFKKAKIAIPAFKEFASPAEAIRYVEKENRGFVSKPCYDEADKNLTYLGKTPAMLIAMLRRWEKEKRLKGSFILQELVKGVEMAVGAWVGPGGFNEGFCENWEEKKLFSGGLGPSTGEMGTVVRYVQRSKLADKVLKPLEEMIVSTGHVGYVDVNCIVDEKGNAWPLEFTCRNGYPTFNIQQELLDCDPVEWLLDLAQGRDTSVFTYDEVAVGGVMAQGDFPFSKLPMKDIVEFPITGAEQDCVHLAQAMAGTAPQEVAGKIVDMPAILTAGDYLLIACGVGDTVRVARKRAYRVLENIKMPNSPFYRTDIGQRLAKELPQLQAKGYAAGLEY